MKQILFLDLEETIIRSWDKPFLINVDKIYAFIMDHQFDSVNIFSYAIYGQDDVKTFNSYAYRDVIEDYLGVKIELVPTCEEIYRSYCNVMKRVALDGDSVHDFCTKEIGFHYYCRDKFENAYCVLLDDTVEHTSVTIFDKHLVTETLNINTDL
jgi:hypothetical protein